MNVVRYIGRTLLIFTLATVVTTASAQLTGTETERINNRYGMQNTAGNNPFQTEGDEEDQEQADTTKKKKRPRKPLESYFFSDSVRALNNFRYNLDYYFNNVTIKGLDTLLQGSQIDYPFLRNGVGDAYLGNLGGASVPLDFSTRPRYRDFNFASAYDAYFFTPSNVDFFNVKRPFTHFNYLSAGQKRYLEENFSITHAQNIAPSTGFNISYKSRGTRGIYSWQRARDKNLSVAFNHTGKRYSVHAGYIYNSVDVRENGGLIDDREVTDSIFELASNIPMKLQDATNKMKNNTFYLVQSYGIPFTQLTERDFSMADKTAVFVGHAIEYSRWYRLYRDTYENTRYTSYLDEGTDDEGKVYDYYRNWYINPAMTSDSTFESLLSNRLFVQIQPWDRNSVVGVINGGIGFDLHRYYQFGLDQYLTGKGKGVKRTSTYVYGSVEGKIKKYVDWGGNVKFYPAGYRGGDLTIGAELALSAYIRQHPVTLSGKFGFSRRSPSFWSDNTFSNHFVWFNSFSKENETRFDIALSAPHYNAEVRGTQSLLTNAIYFGPECEPIQASGNVSVTSLYARKDFRLGGLHLNNRVLLQWSTNQEVVPVPMFSAYLSYFYEFDVVKNVLRVDIGLDGRYNTEYYAFGYNPALAQFYNQREKEIGGYPMIDAFVAAKWKRMRISVKMAHLNDDLFGSRNYFTVLHYPLNKRILKLGFSWGFYD